MNKNRLTFCPEDFENFEVDFPIKEVWQKEGPEILKTIDTIAKENVTHEDIEKFIKAALGKSWDHIFSTDHKNNDILLLGKSEEEIIQIIRMIIRKLYKQNILKNSDNHINTTINGHETYIKMFVHKNGLPRSINCFRAEVGRKTRALGNAIRLMK